MSGLVRKRVIALIITVSVLLSSGIVSGCGFFVLENLEIIPETPEVVIHEQVVPLAQIDPAFVIPMPDAPGLLVESNNKAYVDYSNKHLGYVTVGFSEATDNMLRVLIITPGGNEYIYNLNPGIGDVFPLTSGNGSYTISVHEHYVDNIYKDILFVTIDVVLSDEFVPFTRPNKFVNYCNESPVTAKAIELRKESNSFLDMVDAVYSFVVENISYDYELADTVDFNYKPNLNTILENRSGICFDIATLTAAMLRSQGIPSKLVFGYHYNQNTGHTYHAWVSVFSDEDGMIGNHTYFNGGTWNLLDPTLATMLGQSVPGINGSVTSTSDGSVYHALYYY